jgi:hypothetical protein
MAQPIKETPVLYGKDARRFEERMSNLKPLSEEERKRMKMHYEIFKKKVNK